MDIIESVFVVTIMILFPMFSYFLFASDINNLNKRTNKIVFDLALFSALYFMFKSSSPYIGIKIAFLTVPLLIAYLKDKYIVAIIFSVFIGIYYVYTLEIYSIYVISEFLLYFVFMYFMRRNKESDTTIISVFAIIKITFMILALKGVEADSFEIVKETIMLPFAFFFTTQFIWYLMASTEKIMSLHMATKELEKQKQLQDSLFKITHEIKNPIAVCKGYLDMIDTDNKNQVKRYIPIIKQEIERTLTLMGDFMMLSKINIKAEKMDISVLLQDVSDAADLICKCEGIEFISSTIDEEVYIDGDYDRLKQVFLNIIKNALEAIPKSKKGIIKLEVQIKRRDIIAIVSDNGMGMDKQVLKRIGEAFYTTKKTGTGLGVKFSKEIIDAHNGELYYKSKVNIGTAVTIKLPIKKSLK